MTISRRCASSPHIRSTSPISLIWSRSIQSFFTSRISLSHEKELKMAQALIESMSVVWEPEKYRDEYRTALMEIIEQKAQHKEITTKAPSAPAPTNVVDLVKVLQDSLNRTQAVKQKRSSTRDGNRRSTSTLVKQRRRAGALG